MLPRWFRSITVSAPGDIRGLDNEAGLVDQFRIHGDELRCRSGQGERVFHRHLDDIHSLRAEEAVKAVSRFQVFYKVANPLILQWNAGRYVYAATRNKLNSL